ncbi:MAG TPA: Pvc16 family protein [Bryobacteraceae bacterium]|nr:Pvc16 family protein [Bryobacteraceae bacterium]
MGRFQSLSQVGLVLADTITNNITAGTEVRLAVPLEDPTSAAPAVRITLAWTTPQPQHRNDPPERNPDGSMAPPPPTLSVWYLVSTYGATAEQNAIGAHDLLGQILRAFHVQPVLELPIDGMGEGRLHVTHVPADAEMNEKIWGAMQVRHRPWALFDVGPVQLLRTDPAGPAQPIVHPGGLRMAAIDVLDRARVQRITPSPAGEGGRVRLDAAYFGAPLRVSVGTTRIEPPNMTPLEPGGPVIATLPAAISEDSYDVTITGANNVPSEATSLTVIAASLPSVDAPDTLRHSRVNNLVLEGRQLGAGAVDVVFWPDSGVSGPADVVTISGNAAGTSITIPAGSLAPLRTTTYRISLRHSPHSFTPYVVLEITP